MTLPHRPRGRPKGSGINDRQRLRDIAALIASQPQIKPTTAIKMLGEHDPSVIRRLRDKFYSLQSELMEEVRAGRSLHGGPGIRAPLSMSAIGGAPGAVRTDGSVRANVAAVGPESLSRMAEPPAAPSVSARMFDQHRQRAAETDDQSERTDPKARMVAPTHDETAGLDVQRAKLLDLAAYNVMLGFAIQATVKAMGQQARIYDETLRLPPVAALLKQQIAIGEMVMAMTWPGGQMRFEAEVAAASGG